MQPDHARDRTIADAVLRAHLHGALVDFEDDGDAYESPREWTPVNESYDFSIIEGKRN